MRSASEAHGYVTITQLLATLLALVTFVAMVNIVVAGYGRGVVRAALDEGVRAGVRAGPSAATACGARVHDVLSDLLGGSLGKGVAFSGCVLQQGRLHARADVTLPAWLPAAPDWRFRVEATAVTGWPS